MGNSIEQGDNSDNGTARQGDGKEGTEFVGTVDGSGFIDFSGNVVLKIVLVTMVL